MQYIPVIGGPKPYSSLGVMQMAGEPNPKVPSFATKAEAERFAEQKAEQLNKEQA